MRKTLILTAISMILSSFALGQYGEMPQSRLIDEFGRLGECDRGARLDNLFITLHQTDKSLDPRGSQGVIIFYRSASDLPGTAGTDPVLVRSMKMYLRFRNFDPNAVRFVDGGYREKEVFELWVVPPGAVPPEARDTIPVPLIPADRPFLWDKSRVDSAFGLLEKRQVILDHYLIADQDDAGFDEETREPEQTDEDFYDDGSMVYFQSEQVSDEERDRWIKSSFGEYLKGNSDLSGVMIYYLDDRWFDLQKVATEIERGKKLLSDETNIDETRIQVIFGGYGHGVKAEFWLMKKGMNLPVATPEERPAKEEEPNYGYGEIG